MTMDKRLGTALVAILFEVVLLAAMRSESSTNAQPPPPPEGQAQPGGPPPFGPGGPPPFGPAGPGGFMGPKRLLVNQFDKDGNGWLNKEERQAAREFLKQNRLAGGGRGDFGPRGRGFGPPGFGGRGNQVAAKQGPQVTPAAVTSY